MADPILHIKDTYYFEVPKFMWRSERLTKASFPDVWVRLDPEFQRWQAEVLYAELAEAGFAVPPREELLHDWEHWQHEDHANFAKPLHLYLESNPGADWFHEKLAESSDLQATWSAAKRQSANSDALRAYRQDAPEWSHEKIEQYNHHLSGKILIPQPFGTRRNLYEPESGFCISKFMIIQVVVALLIFGAFTWLAGRLRSGDAPRGRLWNFLEVFLVFLRDEVARPAIGRKEADKFVPVLWTLFFFVLVSNLMGMLPWAGAPTGSFAVTLSLACVTLGTGWFFGTKKFGVIGYWLNQVPSMDLPLAIAIVIKPMLFAIEVLGLMIKHGVLGVRLLANMVAGHIVLLAILGMAFSLEAAASPTWPIAAVISVIASTLFSCLELFVAFLQAYVFTFLSALFIGAAVHRH